MAIETSKPSKMKKKIALLLAFTMVLSILPLNVFAEAGQLSGLPTGALWERTLGRATNLRHWTPGVLVARPGNLDIFRNQNISPSNARTGGGWTTNADSGLAIVPDSGGNLRSILSAMDYFRDQPTQFAASIRMQIHNTRGFMGSLYDGNNFAFLDRGFNYPAGTTTVIGGPAPADPSSGTLPEGTNTSQAQFENYILREVWGNSAAFILRGSVSPASLNLDDPAQLPRRTTTNTWGVNYPIAGSTQTTSAFPWFDTNIRQMWVNHLEANQIVHSIQNILKGTYYSELAIGLSPQQVTEVNALLVRLHNLTEGTSGDAPTLVNNATGVNSPASAGQSTGHFIGTWRPAVMTPAAHALLLEYDVNNAPGTTPTDTLLYLTDAQNISAMVTQVENALNQDVAADGPGTNAGVRTPIITLFPEPPQGALAARTGRGFFMVMLLPRTNNNTIVADQVDLVLLRTELDSWAASPWTSGANVPQIRVPIEYITHGDANNDPIYLTFVHRHQWPQAGESGGRTYLTANQESRFAVGLFENWDTSAATPRTFHRYGRATIPGIRISEAVQSAFDQSDWWVELEIDTPGFYWTSDSIDNLTTRTLYANTTSTNTNDIRPIQFLITPRAVRSPETGNNAHTIVSFPIRLQGVTNNLTRQVNDWLQFEGLSIGATDRARVGDVVVDVRLYRTAPGTGSGQGHWSWHPYPLDGSTASPAGSVGNAAFPNGPSPNQYPQTNPGGNAQTIWYITAPPNSATTLNQTNAVGEFRWNQPAQGATGWVASGDAILDTSLVVARFGEIGLELFVHENDDLESHSLRSGVRDWEFIRVPGPGETRPIGAVLPDESDFTEHQTVRVVLQETAPGSLPATGAHPTVYRFNEGIQVLGVRLWTNEAYFISDHEDDNQTVWFGNQTREADNFLNASIERNSLTIRPEVGRADRRWELARITAEFYISVQAGYESLYGENIDVTVVSGTVEAPFEGTLTVAYAWDPISVETTNVVLDDNNIEAAFGLVRGVNINDIIITERRAGELYVGQRIWLGIEGGISRGWGSADHTALRAESVTITPADTGLQVSPIQHDSHGIFVEVTRGTRGADGATITFSGVQVSGRVVPDHQYNIIVADTAVAHNWEGWGWINAQQADVGFTRGLVRGFFNEEPYVTPAFRFEGNEFYAPVEIPGGGTTTPGTPGDGGTTTTPPTFQPVTLTEGQPSFNSIRTPGLVFEQPLLLLRNPSNPDFVTSYVMFSVVADLLGVEGIWDPATSSATFSDGMGNTVVVTNGSTTALVNGQPRQITASNLPAPARIENDRFYVPVAFFRDSVPEFPIVVIWNEGAVRSITIVPRSS